MPTERACRSCGSPRLFTVLSLGTTPLANAFRTHEQLALPEPRFPLDLVFCGECSLVQITETVPPEQLFSDYLYFSSFSDTMVRHASELVARLVTEQRLDATSLAAEVASNDGYLLQFYTRRGIPVLGIEPASNIARVATERGIRTLCAFFGTELADAVVAEHGRADVIHANNVLAHVADLNGFVRGLARLVSPTGMIVIEVPYVRDMLERVEFDTIYHEHLCYFSLTALDTLLRRHGLIIHDVERLEIHGGSLRIFAGTGPPPQPRVTALLAEERSLGMDRPEFYACFAEQVGRLKRELVALLTDLRASGKRIAAYGASAKGSTLLNYVGIGKDQLDFVVDRSTVKQGRYTPGTGLRIRSPEALLDDRPDYVLLLTWNFKDEILQQQDSYRRQGGKFIVPVPTPVVV